MFQHVRWHLPSVWCRSWTEVYWPFQVFALCSGSSCHVLTEHVMKCSTHKTIVFTCMTRQLASSCSQFQLVLVLQQVSSDVPGCNLGVLTFSVLSEFLSHTHAVLCVQLNLRHTIRVEPRNHCYMSVAHLIVLICQTKTLVELHPLQRCRCKNVQVVMGRFSMQCCHC